jgi:hypothetical protein
MTQWREVDRRGVMNVVERHARGVGSTVRWRLFMWIRTGVARDDEGRIVKMNVGNLPRAIRIDKSKIFVRRSRS